MSATDEAAEEYKTRIVTAWDNASGNLPGINDIFKAGAQWGLQRAVEVVREMISKRRPTHGTCCTCQACGWDYDNCRCSTNETCETLLCKLQQLQPKDESRERGEK